MPTFREAGQARNVLIKCYLIKDMESTEQMDTNGLLKTRVLELYRSLEDKENKLSEANELISALREEVEDLRQELRSRESRILGLQGRVCQELTSSLQPSLPVEIKTEPGFTDLPSSSTSCATEASFTDPPDRFKREESPVPLKSLSVTLVDCGSLLGADRKAALPADEEDDGVCDDAGEDHPLVIKYEDSSSEAEEQMQDDETEIKKEKNYERRGRTKRTFSCCQCGMTLCSPWSLKVHEMRHSGKRPYKCTQCGKSFFSFLTLEDHEKLQLQCTDCQVDFATSDCISIHTKLDEGDQTYVCPRCEVVFTDSSDFKVHYRRHTKESLFECQVCAKCFLYPWSYNKHVKTHSGERPYQCLRCGKAFSLQDHLRRHMLTHPSEKTDKFSQYKQRPEETSQGRENERLTTGLSPRLFSIYEGFQ
ncbi:zinc finger protein 611-like isoform X2 [Denticeps clupeoides]|uniref:zinc finger protein 611-like isoform X2 n=1 Tax=Denticeps clupeoides TaxID=299321 RepID=UPI0010A535C5|nr:zinc finger protein 611-like isoform X2 [Denticeps clupeoides]